MASKRRTAECKHASLIYQPSSHALEAGYKRAGASQLISAAQLSDTDSGNGLLSSLPLESTFPAPLVLPGDDLSCDPHAEMQTVKHWLLEKHRNAVTPQRRTLYVMPAPEISRQMQRLSDWTVPNAADKPGSDLSRPRTQAVADYLAAFYNGIPVKMLPALRFAQWEDSKTRGYVGLQTNKEMFGVQYRKGRDGTYSHQLNLNHLLDVAINVLPSDAYALIMLVHHDLYEDEEDDFCCGRAYGGSRVCVVSTARYHPVLDEIQAVERPHAWPASHCQAFTDSHCGREISKKLASRKRPRDSISTAMEAAVIAYQNSSSPNNQMLFEKLWLGRVCKTASHELGHCFGIDHCTYYACIMQGTTGLSEDVGQPPYLCPIDLVKVLYAISSAPRHHYEALLTFCGEQKGDRMFDSFAAWLKVRLLEI